MIMQSRLNEPVCELFVDEKNDLDCSDHQIKEGNSALIFGFYYTIVLAQVVFSWHRYNRVSHFRFAPLD